MFAIACCSLWHSRGCRALPAGKAGNTEATLEALGQRLRTVTLMDPLKLPEAAMEQHMIACVHESLGLYLMENARFMAERLVAEYPSQVRSGLACARLTAACSAQTWNTCLFAQLEDCKMGSHLMLPVYVGAWDVISGESLLHDREAGCRVPVRGRGSLVCKGEAVATRSAAGSAHMWTARISE